MEVGPISEFVAHKDGANRVFAHGKKSGLLFACGSTRGAVTVWAFGCTSAPLRAFQFTEIGSDAAVSGVHFDSMEELLVGCADKAIRVWDLRNGCLVRKLSCTAALTAVHFHPNTTTELLASSNAEGCLKVWDMRRRRVVHEIPSAGRLLGFSPDGEVMAVLDGSLAKFFHPVSGFLLGSADLSSASSSASAALQQQPAALAFHPRKRQATLCSVDGHLWTLLLPSAAITQRAKLGFSDQETTCHIEYGRKGKNLLIASGRRFFCAPSGDLSQAVEHSSILPSSPSEMTVRHISAASKLPLLILGRSRTLQIVPLQIPATSGKPVPSSSSSAAPFSPPSSTLTFEGPSQSTRCVEQSSTLVERPAAPQPPRPERTVSPVRIAEEASMGSLQRGASVNSLSRGEGEDETPMEYLREHAESMSLMTARLRTLRMVKSLWAKGMKTAAIEQLAKANSPGAMLDFLRAVDVLEKPAESTGDAAPPSHVTRVFTVEQFALLLPPLRGLVLDPIDAQACAAISAINTLLRAFGTMVAVGVRGSQSGSRSGSSATACRAANSEVAALRKVVSSDSAFSRRTLKVKKARRDLVATLKATQ